MNVPLHIRSVKQTSGPKEYAQASYTNDFRIAFALGRDLWLLLRLGLLNHVGLDTLPPNVAITAMNAMNVSVRNGVFMPAFFGTPVVLVLTCTLAFLAGQRKVALLIGAGALVYIFGAFVPTANINVPMNLELETYVSPLLPEEAQAIWAAYSPRWQFWNTMRTIASGFTLLMVGFALYSVPRRA